VLESLEQLARQAGSTRAEAESRLPSLRLLCKPGDRVTRKMPGRTHGVGQKTETSRLEWSRWFEEESTDSGVRVANEKGSS
jgi:hypothetical protein